MIGSMFLGLSRVWVMDSDGMIGLRADSVGFWLAQPPAPLDDGFNDEIASI